MIILCFLVAFIVSTLVAAGVTTGGLTIESGSLIAAVTGVLTAIFYLLFRKKEDENIPKLEPKSNLFARLTGRSDQLWTLKLQEADDKIFSLKTQLREQEDENGFLSEMCGQLEESNFHSQENEKNLRAGLASMKEQLQTLYQDYRELEEDRKDLGATLFEQSEEMVSVLHKVDELEVEIGRKEETQKALKKLLLSLEKEIQLSREQNFKLAAENQNLNNLLQDKERQLKDKVSTIESHIRFIDKQAKEMANLNQQIEEEDETGDEIIEALHDELQTVRNQKADVEAQFQALHNENQKLNEQLETARRLMREIQIEKAKMDKEIETANSKKEEAITLLKKAVTAHKELEADWIEKTAEIVQLQKNEEDLKQKLTAIKKFF